MCRRQGLINHQSNEPFCFGRRTMQCPEGYQCSIPASCFHCQMGVFQTVFGWRFGQCSCSPRQNFGGIVGMGAQLGIAYGPNMLSFRDHDSWARCSKKSGLPEAQTKTTPAESGFGQCNPEDLPQPTGQNDLTRLKRGRCTGLRCQDVGPELAQKIGGQN